MWNIESGAIKSKLHPPKSKSAIPTDQSVEKLAFMKTQPYVLLSSGADGFVRFWNVLTSTLLMELDCKHVPGESIVSLCLSDDCKRLMTADSIGCVKVWDLSDLNFELHAFDKVEGMEAVELAHWRAHSSSVSSVQYVSVEGLTSSFWLTAGSDNAVHLWSSDGTHVGIFGTDAWKLNDPATWRASEPKLIHSLDDIERTVWTAEEEKTEEVGEGATTAEPVVEVEVTNPAVQVYKHRTEAKAHKKPTPMSKRVFLPKNGRAPLNHPHIGGCKGTSIHHLLHFEELRMPEPRAPSKVSGAENLGWDHPPCPASVPADVMRPTSKLSARLDDLEGRLTPAPLRPATVAGTAPRAKKRHG